MLYVTNYRLRPHMAKGEVKKLMDIFGTRGPRESSPTTCGSTGAAAQR